MKNDVAIRSKRKKKKSGAFHKRLWRRLRVKLAQSHFVTDVVVLNLARGWLNLVHATNRLVHYDVERADRLIDTVAPVIVTCWHGQHFMMPFFSRRGHPSVAMVSRSKDAELNARVIERMGFETVRASGRRVASRMHEKGALRGLVAMRKHLRDGKSVFMIADIPHGTPREAGRGVVAIARMAGVPILPVAYASSRRRVIESTWDKSVLNLPFGRAAFCIGEPIEVPEDADDEALEKIRVRVQDELNRVFDEAYSIVDAPA